MPRYCRFGANATDRKEGAAATVAVRYKYEIMLQTEDGRWLLTSVAEEEAPALSAARSLLASGKYPAVRIVRERRGVTGFLSSTEVFHEKRPPQPKQKVEVLPAARHAVDPQSLDDLNSPACRRVLRQIMQRWLAEQVVTTPELLHNATALLRFRRHESLMMSTLNQFIAAQEGVAGKPMDRLGRVERLFGEAAKRVQEYQRGRPPALRAAADLPAVLAALPSEPAARRFAVNATLAAYLGDFRVWLAKLDEVLAILRNTDEAEIHALCDTMMAEAIELSDALKEMLGHHNDLGGALKVLADLVSGRGPTFGRGAWDKGLGFAALVGSGELPQTRDALVERMRRSLAGRVPLTAGGIRVEGLILTDLRLRMTDPDGALIGGDAMDKAFDSRWSRIREAVLEG